MQAMPDILMPDEPALAADAQGFEDYHREQDSAGRNRLEAAAALLADPEVRRGIGSAWSLYMMLVLDWEGEAGGTRDEIGGRMGEPGRNVGNWIGALETAGIVNVSRSGRSMTVRLADEHLEAARKPVAVLAPDKEKADDPDDVDEKDRDLIDFVHRAKGMGKVEIRISLDAR